MRRNAGKRCWCSALLLHLSLIHIFLLFLCMYPACLCHTLTSGKCSQPGLRNQKYFLIQTAGSYNCWLSFRTYSGYGVSSLHTAALHPLSHLQGHFAAVSVLPASHRNLSLIHILQFQYRKLLFSVMVLHLQTEQKAIQSVNT